MLYTNAPWCSSAYGRIAAKLCPAWHRAGYPTALANNYGLQGGILDWGGVKVYPHGGGLSEVETMQHYRHFKADVLIILYDMWVMDNIPNLVRENRVTLVTYAPVDHLDVYPKLEAKLRVAFHILAMSRYAERLMRMAGFTNLTYLPHGVDCDAFYPIDASKEALRQKLGFEPDSFVIGMVQMNKGFRKGIPRQLEAVKIFCDQNPDVKTRLYMHTAAKATFDLPDLQKLLGIQEIARFPEDYDYTLGWDDKQLCVMYNGFDVLLQGTWGEGFGMPVIEANACGVPVVASNSTAMTELLKPTPELLVRVNPTDYFWTQIPSKIPKPDPYDMAEKLERVYNRGPETYGEKVRKWALGYDWDRVVTPTSLRFLEYLQQELEDRCAKPPEPSPGLKPLSEARVIT